MRFWGQRWRVFFYICCWRVFFFLRGNPSPPSPLVLWMCKKKKCITYLCSPLPLFFFFIIAIFYSCPPRTKNKKKKVLTIVSFPHDGLFALNRTLRGQSVSHSKKKIKSFFFFCYFYIYYLFFLRWCQQNSSILNSFAFAKKKGWITHTHTVTHPKA